MTLQSSGAISMSQIRSEFGGGSGAISFADFYRGGSKVRSKAGNNTATNLAANVPTSGAIAFSSFYGQARAFRKTYTATATNQNASAVFGDDYGVDYPKEIVINSGVELGATGTGDEALQINSGLSGSMSITNNGTLSGAGGSAGGGAGGDAFEANVACILINNGTIRAGGGGGGNGGNGGNGGTGGQGVVTTTSQSYGSWNTVSFGQFYNQRIDNVTTPNQVRSAQFSNSHSNNFSFLLYKSGSNGSGTTLLERKNQQPLNAGSTAVNNVASIFYRNRNNSNGETWSNGGGSYQYRLLNTTTTNTYYNGGSGGSGGSGGAGGRGQGYNHGNQNGSGGSAGAGGSAGGSNAGAGGQGGTGGTGGNGGGYGAAGGNGSSGSTGNTGANGNHTGGSAGSGGSGGSSGGAAGKYIRGLSNVTFTNNGTVQGGTA